jgi:protein gp37
MRNREYWDEIWNVVGGCEPQSEGCLNCYAAKLAGTRQWDPLHKGTTKFKLVEDKRRHVFIGAPHLTVLPPTHPTWIFPLTLPRAPYPKLGPGQPSLIFIEDMAELFLEGRDIAIIDEVMTTMVASEHIGLVVGKCVDRIARYFTGKERWQSKLWLIFSAENQARFDERWPYMRELAQRGWLVGVSIVPMIAPVWLPDDSLSLIRWVIVNGEEGPHQLVRDTHPDWMRAVRDQCVPAGIPFFVRGMRDQDLIPPDLAIFRQFPRWPEALPQHETFPT